MKTIVAIGGAVIKTAWPEIKEVAERGMIDVLIHNGGSIFHDFQMDTDNWLKEHGKGYYTLDEMLESPTLAEPTAKLVWNWVINGEAPHRTLTEIMQSQGKTVLMFTAPGCDFWHLYETYEGWEILGKALYNNLAILKALMRGGNFHYICMGSAVIHPEIFKTVLATTHPKNFRADVVDFLPKQYRPKTRVAKYGEYFEMAHKDFLNAWMMGIYEEVFKTGNEANR